MIRIESPPQQERGIIGLEKGAGGKAKAQLNPQTLLNSKMSLGAKAERQIQIGAQKFDIRKDLTCG